MDEVEKGRKDLSNTSDDDKIVAEAVRIANIKRQVISTFPIPNTKDDLVEFITMSSGLTIKKFPLGDTLIGRLLVILLITLVIGTLILLVLVIADVDDEIIENTSAGICLFFILGCMAYGLYGKNPDRLEHNILADAWKSKVNQCMAKAKMMITNSAELAQLDSIANPPKEGFSLMGFIKNVLNK